MSAPVKFKHTPPAFDFEIVVGDVLFVGFGLGFSKQVLVLGRIVADHLNFLGLGLTLPARVVIFHFFKQRIVCNFIYEQKASSLERAASSRSESFFRNPQHSAPLRQLFFAKRRLQVGTSRSNGTLPELPRFGSKIEVDRMRPSVAL